MMKQLLVIFLLLGCALWIDLTPVQLPDTDTQTITITIQGDVADPKEVQLPLYASVQQALDTVHPNETADLTTLNPSQILKDHDILIIPTKQEDFQRISINSATLQQLSTLPGIGETTAQRIIDYRDQNGLFQQLEDLMEVKGIGPAKYEKLKDYIAL